MTRNNILILICFLVLRTLLFGQTGSKTTVYFDFNESRLNNNCKKSLDSLIQYLKPLTVYTIHLDGHTDNIGSDNYNDKLSAARVIAVREYFSKKQIDATAIQIDNYGEKIPMIPNVSESNRAVNRRVEITIDVQKKISVIQSATSPEQQIKDSLEKSINELPIVPIGSSIIGGYNITVITNTNEMEANNFTTMTVQDSALASNLIICWEPEKGKPIPKEPLTLRIPARQNPYCKLPQVNFYDSQNDSASGLIKWNELLFPGWKSEVINGNEYFTIVIYPLDMTRRCANMDCKKLYEAKSQLLLASKKYTIKQVKIIYESANALMIGYETSKNLWTLRLWPLKDMPSPTIKLKIVDKKGNEKTISTKLENLKTNKAGVYIIRKRQLKKML